MPKIIKITESLFDVFTGDGWENWSRFKKQGKILRLVGGAPLPPAVYHQVYEHTVK